MRSSPHSLETINEFGFSRFSGSFEPIFDSNFGGNINFRLLRRGSPFSRLFADPFEMRKQPRKNSVSVSENGIGNDRRKYLQSCIFPPAVTDTDTVPDTEFELGNFLSLAEDRGGTLGDAIFFDDHLFDGSVGWNGIHCI